MARTTNPDRATPIFAAVHRLVLSGGCESATVRAVALEADMSPSGVRHNFRTHSHLLACAYFRADDVLERHMQMTYFSLDRRLRGDRWTVTDAAELLACTVPIDPEGLEILRVLHSFEARARHDEDVGDSVAETHRQVHNVARAVLQRIGIPAEVAEEQVMTLKCLVMGVRNALVPIARTPWPPPGESHTPDGRERTKSISRAVGASELAMDPADAVPLLASYLQRLVDAYGGGGMDEVEVDEVEVDALG